MNTNLHEINKILVHTKCYQPHLVTPSKVPLIYPSIHQSIQPSIHPWFNYLESDLIGESSVKEFMDILAQRGVIEAEYATRVIRILDDDVHRGAGPRGASHCATLRVPQLHLAKGERGR